MQKHIVKTFLPKTGKPVTYSEGQKRWISDNEIEIGDWVYVLRMPEDDEMGWPFGYNNTMSKMVGGVYKIINITEEGIFLHENRYIYPYFVLEKFH